MERDGLTSALEDVGALVLANACGPCIGQVSSRFERNQQTLITLQWKRIESSEENGTFRGIATISGTDHSPLAILTSFNRYGYCRFREPRSTYRIIQKFQGAQ